jgi:hypothetical protein
MSDMLPDLELSGQQIGVWKPEDGWLGLVPDLNTVDDAISLLGPVTDESEMENARDVVFRDGLIRVTVLKDQHSIAKIWLSGALQDPALIPANLSDARRQFGQLKPTRMERFSGVIFEGAGVRLACTPTSDPKRVEWMEIYRPQP